MSASSKASKASKAKAKRKAADLEDTDTNHVVFSVPTLKRVQFTVTTDAGSTKTTPVFQRLPTSLPPPLRPPAPTLPEPAPEPEQPKKTQKAQLLEDFADHFDELGRLLLEFEADELVGSPCGCGAKALATTQCHDCTAYATSCSNCFVQSHVRNPFHWAEVWDELQGFFVRHDISKLGHVIQLGHNGDPCPSPCGERIFTIVDENGIHSTRLAFCGCHELPPNKVKQLMRARLFPATTRNPETAFTFKMLKGFQLHNLESKKAAYDYLGAIRRLTDNSFTADVANPYAAFLCVVRVFNYLTLKKRAGQFHGIDAMLPHRPSGNLLVWCPACPEPGLNSDPNCPKTPHNLRHLNQSQRTLDGNFQCNQFSKNTHPNDVSLCEGKGYFPLDSEYRKYIASVPVSKEKSTCNYLKAVNKQDKKKFKNMAITGTVNCQCSHVFILSCVDLYHGERFANTDMALATELYRHQPNESFQVKLQFEVNDIDQVTTYDIACEYFIYLEERFRNNFPDLVPMIKRMRWGVPALHVQGHQDSCTYLFGTAYMECVAHFHGETAEQYWPEANQLGPHVRQMNNGHRQDTMINHHGDWNHKKTMDMAASLAEDIAEAKQKFVEKRNHFIGLSASFREHLSKWRALPRTPTKKGKEAVSVYKHNTTKVPSQEAIYRKMLNDESAFGSTMIPKSKVAQFLEEGLMIQDVQFVFRLLGIHNHPLNIFVVRSKLCGLINDTEDHGLVSKQKEIKKRTAKLQTRLLGWRKIQTQLMPNVGDRVAGQKALVQCEKLFLPSDFSAPERQALGLLDLAVEEAKWREGQAFDHLRRLQNVVKTITALRNRKTRDERKQKENTRAGDNIRVSTAIRDQHMAGYEAARVALAALDAESKFIPLTESDLYMKSVQQKRRVGDSRHIDGALWRLQASMPIEEDIDMDVDETEVSAPVAFKAGTQMDRRQSGPHAKHKTMEPKKAVDERPAGWLWQLGKLSKMSDSEMDEWSLEGDRVQWFRAEAEMQRWQEQGEQKLAELLRTNRSFQKMDLTWSALAQTDLPTGHKAYARQKAAMYRKRAEEAQTFVVAAGYGALLKKDGNLIERVQSERAKEARFLADAEGSLAD